jgi:hypothetical protein
MFPRVFVFVCMAQFTLLASIGRFSQNIHHQIYFGICHSLVISLQEGHRITSTGRRVRLCISLLRSQGRGHRLEVIFHSQKVIVGKESSRVVITSTIRYSPRHTQSAVLPVLQRSATPRVSYLAVGKSSWALMVFKTTSTSESHKRW